MNIRKNLKTILIIYIISLTIRLIFAPFSAGSDIAQFSGFADTFRSSGLCFYVESSSPLGEKWPYPWLYPYGPLLILLLYPLRLIAPEKVVTYYLNGTYYVKVPFQWILATKVTFSVIDAFIPVLIYIIARRKLTNKQSLTISLIYSLSPMAIYNSAIYGMFDHIALLFMILSILYIYNKNFRISGFLAGLSLLTKLMFLFPYLGLLLYGIKRYKRKVVLWFAYSLLSIALFMMPFTMVCPQTVPSLYYILMWRGSPQYKLPLAYSINGVTSLATYLHLNYKYNTIFIIKDLWMIFLLILPMTVVITYIEGPFAIALYWYLSFLLGFWGDNPQFLVPLIGLGLLAFVESKKRKEKIFMMILILWSSLWASLFPLDFWFKVHTILTNKFAMEIARLLVLYVPGDLGYTMYSLTLYIIELTLIISSFISSVKRLIKRRG